MVTETSSDDGRPIIELYDVERRYRLGKTDVQALRGVSAVIHRGEFTAVAGPSGSGKTTLLNLCGCIDKPDAGRIVICGEDVTSRATHQLALLRNRCFGFIFQTFNLIPVLNVYENVEYPLLIRGVPKSERRVRVEELLARVGLTERRRHRPRELSGGQRQRVAIARALVAEPLAVLADEPTGNLDSKTGSEVIALMAELNESRHVTFLFSTHDSHILSQARRVLRMTDGTVSEDTVPVVAELASVA